MTHSPRLSLWIAPVPILQVDHYLLAMRWIIILGISAIGLSLGRNLYFGADDTGIFVGDILIVLLVVAGYNVLVSILAWRMQPVNRGRVGWFLLADSVQAVLATALTGGSSSFFFLLFLIVVVEAGLVFQWPVAVALTTGIGVCSIAAALLNPLQQWNAMAAANVMVKFLAILLMGGVVDLFGEQMRREHAARQTAALAAAQMAVLNEISLRLGESQLEPERIFHTLLDSTRTLPDLAFCLVVLSHPVDPYWYVAASNTDRHPVGQRVQEIKGNNFTPPFFSTEPDPPQPQSEFFLVGVGTTRPLPEFVAGDGITQLIGVSLVLPTGATTGAIVVGRRTDRPLSNDERFFLRSLAGEAGLALRNAHLYAREQDQVERLRRFESLQATFFSAAAHELKTPLTVLKTLTSTLRQLTHLPPSTQLEILDTIEQNLDRLDLLVNDMLESARLEAGMIALHPRSVDLTNRTQRVLDRLAPLLERKQQRLTLQIDPGLPAVRADGKRVEQILTNLIDNAAKCVWHRGSFYFMAEK